MKIEIRDAEAVRAIQPVDAALYLRAAGWSSISTVSRRFAMWSKRTDADEYEAMLPMDLSAGDYALRIGELLQLLAAVESRSQSEIYRDLLTISSDVIRIRIADPDLSDGTIPIEEHAQIAQKARDLMLAGACAATRSQAVWHKKKPQRAIDHVRRVRIGQSERGSYVVTLVSRVTPELHGQGQNPWLQVVPFERRVTQTLASSLLALNGAAQHAAITQDMDAFDKSVAQGVNSNLCDAVVGLWGGDEVQRTIDIGFTWSPSRPVADSIPRRVEFSSDRLPIIREAARRLREKAPIPDVTLEGMVQRLERLENAWLGYATVLAPVNGRKARVTIELDPSGYSEAVRAHFEHKPIRISGTLRKEGRGYLLSDAEKIVVIGNA